MAKQEKELNPTKEVKRKIVNTVKKVVKPEKKPAKQPLFETKPDLEKLYLLIAVVDIGVSKSVEKLMQHAGSSMQFTHNGRGTAPKEILNVLGVVDNTKGVVNAVLSESKVETAIHELEIFFAASKKNRGIAFTIPFASIEGVRIYKYLTQTF